MDITPLYELRNRLRAAMIAGTNLIEEDFRLKKAVEGVKPLEGASPVFAKIVKACEELTGGKGTLKETELLDTITLLDAVLCTQGVVGVNNRDSIKGIETSGSGIMLKNVPYSTLKPVLEALTTSGNGHLAYLTDIYDRTPDIFKDYRVLTALVTALGAGFAELAEFAEELLKQNGKEILPLLMNDFNPKGKKEMLRRLNVIETIAGGDANDFYVANLSEAEKDLRQALIYALRHNGQNTELLTELAKAEKGNAKKLAYAALACMESEGAEAFFEDICRKKPETVMESVYLCKTRWASKMAARCFREQLEKWKEISDRGEKIVVDKKEEELLNNTLLALVGKNGEEVCEVFKEVVGLEEKFRIISEQTKSEYAGYLHTDFRTVGYRCYGDLFRLKDIPRVKKSDDLVGFKAMISHILKLNLIINPDENLKNLVMELQENTTFLSASVTAELLYNENFCEWIQEKLENKAFIKWLGNKNKKQTLDTLAKEMIHMHYDENMKQYVLTAELLNANKQWCVFKQPVKTDVKGTLTGFMMNQHRAFDAILAQCIDTEDTEYKKRLEEYFYQCALTVSGDECEKYWPALIKCGCEKCEGLFVRAVSTQNNVYGYTLDYMFDRLPGTREAKIAEANKLYDLICENKIQVEHINYEYFYKRINNPD